MIKKILAIVLVVAIVALASFKLFFSKGDIKKDIAKIGENVTSYHSEATMKLYVNDDKRVFYVTVDYQKGTTDQFRISLLDENVNQEQIMLKNAKGVFVLTPLVNQVYSFKGEYPLNETKPYLYHSIINAIKGDYTCEKLNDGYLITFVPKVSSQPSWIKEEVKLSKDLKPVFTNIYDVNNTLVCEVTFTKFELATTYNADFFEVETNMKASQENVISSSKMASEEDLPLLPVSLSLTSELKEQTSGKIDDVNVFILTYQGPKEFTIVQHIVTPSPTIEYKEVNGQIVDLTLGLGFYFSKALSYLYNGVSYSIYSSSLTMAEMIDVANSLEVVIEK